MIALLLLIVGLVVGYWLFASPYSQVFGLFPFRGKTRERVVALTFDDGPNEPYTSQIADYLDGKKIQATFFQVGACIDAFPDVTLRLHKAGHVIGLHSYSHRFSKNFTEPSLTKEIARTRSAVVRAIGKDPLLFRPPWLWRSPLLFRELRSRRLRAVSGVFCSNIEPLQPAAQRMAKSTLRKVKPGTILIFHDGYDARGGRRDQTVEAVKIVVESLQERGYGFVTVDTLLNTPAYR